MSLPFFVYGTLMPGCSNYGILKGKTIKEIPATTEGRMYDIGPFPAVVEGKGSIKGYLIYIKEHLVEKVHKELDKLEGYNPQGFTLYDKRVVEVIKNDGNVTYAWMYLWSLSTEDFKEIPSGDWVTYSLAPTLKLGSIYMTPGVMEVIPRSDIEKALSRHEKCDWGEVCKEDWEMNDQAFELGNRIISVYTSKKGVKFWIITEADRSSTTILLPEEY